MPDRKQFLLQWVVHSSSRMYRRAAEGGSDSLDPAAWARL